MVRTKCIRHPADAPLVIIHQWQSDLFKGDKIKAALLSVFEYWHGVKLSMTSSKDEKDLLQWHSQVKLESYLLGIGKRRAISDAVKEIEKEGFIKLFKSEGLNQTHKYLFLVDAVQEWVDHWNDVYTEHKDSDFGDYPICVVPNLCISTNTHERSANVHEGSAGMHERSANTQKSSANLQKEIHKENTFKETTSEITLETTLYCADENDNRSQISDEAAVEPVQDKKKRNVPSHHETQKAQYEKEFEELVWPVTYNKKAKAKAMSSYCTIRKEVMKTDDQRDDLLEAWRYVNEVVYPAKHKQDGTKQFIPMPTTWFNQHRWNDEDIQEGIHNRFITGDSTPPIDLNSLSKEQKADYERKSNLMAFYAKQQQKNGGTAA